MWTTPSMSSACFRSGIAFQRRRNSSRVSRSPSRSGGGWIGVAAAGIETYSSTAIAFRLSWPRIATSMRTEFAGPRTRASNARVHVAPAPVLTAFNPKDHLTSALAVHVANVKDSDYCAHDIEVDAVGVLPSAE